jgi:hypothetical protein
LRLRASKKLEAATVVSKCSAFLSVMLPEFSAFVAPFAVMEVAGTSVVAYATKQRAAFVALVAAEFAPFMATVVAVPVSELMSVKTATSAPSASLFLGVRRRAHAEQERENDAKHDRESFQSVE